MATYVVGDVQGCYESLRKLLENIPFDFSADELWFVGDLINRGPQSLETLRFVRNLGKQATTVLGNHDLHLLSIIFGGHSSHREDTFHDVLDAPDCEELAHWLRSLPLIHKTGTHVMVHAGIPHIWNLDFAGRSAREVEEAIRGNRYEMFFKHMYGNEPNSWCNELKGIDRLRVITNYLTRMRLVNCEGVMEFSHKGSIDKLPDGFDAWFHYPTQIRENIVFGHWASLEGVTNVPHIFALDTGCVWGRQITSLRLEDHCLFKY